MDKKDTNGKAQINDEAALFSRIKTVMEKEVEELPQKSSRRGFLQAVISSFAVFGGSVALAQEQNCPDPFCQNGLNPCQPCLSCLATACQNCQELGQTCAGPWLACATECEIDCQGNCEINCQSTCETHGGCQGGCQTNCVHPGCQIGCEHVFLACYPQELSCGPGTACQGVDLMRDAILITDENVELMRDEFKKAMEGKITLIPVQE